MKRIGYLTLIIITGFITLSFINKGSERESVDVDPEIKWYTWEEAIELNKTEPRDLFIDVYTDWCGYCKKMDRHAFCDPDIIQYLNKNFYSIKLNAEQKEDIMYNNQKFSYVKTKGRTGGIHVLAYSLLDGKLSYPSIVYMNSDIERVLLAPGYKTAKQLMPELKFTKEKHYLNKSFDTYIGTLK